MKNTPWEFEQRGTNSETECHAVVVNSEYEVLFDTLNAHTHTYQVSYECDEDGGHYYHEGEAVDALKLAAAAPELLDAVLLVKRYLDALEGGLEENDPLRAIRRSCHAPLHEAINAALEKVGTRRLF